MARPSAKLDHRRLHLAVRADASPDIGAGHVMRCAALADAWTRADEGSATIYGTIEIPFVEGRLQALGIPVEDWSRYRDDRAVLLVDSYRADVRSDGAAAPAAIRVLADDLGGKVSASFDAVWNPNAYGSAGLYHEFSGLVITGADSIPIRDDLPTWAGQESDTVGLTLGGGGASVMARAIAEALHDALGGRRLATTLSLLPVAQVPVDAAHIWTELSQCAAVICAAGTTLWEAAAVGVPVVVVAVAENQLAGLTWARQHGVPAIDLTDVEDPRRAVRSVLHDLGVAKPLPRLTSGAHRVAERLATRARNASRQ